MGTFFSLTAFILCATMGLGLGLDIIGSKNGWQMIDIINVNLAILNLIIFVRDINE